MDPLRCVLLIQNNEIEKNVIEYAANFNSFQIEEIFQHPIEAIEKLNHICPEILILNIDVVGFDAVEFLKMIHRPPFIIGITTKVSSAISLLNNGFTDLLLSQFTLEDFCKKISKIITIIHSLKGGDINNDTASDIAMVYKNEESISVPKEYMFLKHRRTSIKIKFDDIEYIQNVGNVLKIYDISGKFLYHSSTLARMLLNLPSDRFIRLNKSIIVNYSKIDKIEGNVIYIKDKEFKLSRTYSMQMMKILT